MLKAFHEFLPILLIFICSGSPRGRGIHISTYSLSSDGLFKSPWKDASYSKHMKQMTNNIKWLTWKNGCCKHWSAVGLLDGSHEQSCCVMNGGIDQLNSISYFVHNICQQCKEADIRNTLIKSIASKLAFGMTSDRLAGEIYQGKKKIWVCDLIIHMSVIKVKRNWHETKKTFILDLHQNNLFHTTVKHFSVLGS